MIKNILLIDDDADEHLLFRIAAENVNQDLFILEAYSCKHASMILQHVTPDVIFLDINLPGENGLRFLEKLRNDKHTSSIPVYMYSTGMSSPTLAQAITLGAKGCLEKGDSQRTFCDSMTKILKEVSLKSG